jgi:hypothetical protein
MNSTPELTLEKLQLIATSNVAPIHKVKWIKLFNSSVATREASRFPAKPANEEKLGNFLVRACWWAGVCVCGLILSCLFRMMKFLVVFGV